jgi:hypothetical protein
MASAKIFRINYKSDFILTLESDAGWMTPFCIKFWTGAPSQAYYVGWDGETYNHCSFDPSEPTKLQVQFDDHHLPIGELKYQVAYHFTVADFPNDTEDEVINPANITTEIDGETYQVMLDFTGETAPEIQFALPAYANEAQRIANEQQRIAAETQRIANEETRIANEQTRINQEQTRQQNEQQRINQEQARVNEYATLKADAVAATDAANDAATLAQQKAEYAQQQGGYAKDQGDYAKNQGDYAKEQGDTALADHQRAESDHVIAIDDHTQAGNDHTRAEADHGIAIDDHTQAGNDHTRAESDHATAAADHTQAGQDHTTAASDHSRAESDHTTAAADHTQAGQDHTTAASDHGIAAEDHTQAGNDHTRAESDHATAAADHTQAGNDHTRAESDHTRAESDHAAVEVYVDSLGAFDISAYHATGGVLAKYADLTAALGTNGANIPEAIRKGGMSVKYVQTSDNKYVQFRYMLQYKNTTAGNAEFINIANWQGMYEDKGLHLINSQSIFGKYGINKIPIRIWDPTWLVNDGSDCFLFLVKPNDSIEIKASTRAFQYALLKSYSTPSNGDIIDYCTGTGRTNVAANNTVTITAPADAVLLCVSNIIAGYESYFRAPASIKINGEDPYYSKSITEVIADIKNTINNLPIVNSYPNGVLEYNSSSKYFIYYSNVRGTNKYYGFKIGYEENNSDTVYIKDWRLLNGSYYEYDGTSFIKKAETIDSGENEMTMYFSGKIDYTGGYHGDERIDISPLSFVKFFADGKMITPTEMESDFTLNCDSFEYIQLSTLHETSSTQGQFVENHPIVAYHYKHNCFKNCASYLENTIKMASQQIVTQYHAGLCCVHKNVATYGFLPSTVLTPELTGTNEHYDANNIEDARVYMWNPTTGLRCYVEGHFEQGLNDKTDIQQYQIWDRSADSKYYRRFVSSKFFEEGSIIRNKQVVQFY